MIPNQKVAGSTPARIIFQIVRRHRHGLNGSCFFFGLRTRFSGIRVPLRFRRDTSSLTEDGAQRRTRIISVLGWRGRFGRYAVGNVDFCALRRKKPENGGIEFDVEVAFVDSKLNVGFVERELK